MNVQSLRKEAGFTQEELADLAGFHRTYISQVERQVKNVSADNLDRIAEVFDVPSMRLLALPRSET